MTRIFHHYVPGHWPLLASIDAALVACGLFAGFELGILAADHLWTQLGGQGLPIGICALVMTGLYALTFHLHQTLAGGPRHRIAWLIGSLALALLVMECVGLATAGAAFVAQPATLAFNLMFAATCTCRLLVYDQPGFGRSSDRVLLVGSGQRAREAVEANQRCGNPSEIVAFLPLAGNDCAMATTRTLSAGTSLAEAVKRLRVDEIVLAVAQRRGGVLPMEDLLECRLHGVRVVEFSSFLERIERHVRVDSLNPSWLILAEGFNHTAARDLVKRAFDICASLLLFALTWPLMLVTALAIRLESPGPLIYSQERVGAGGRVYRIYKFRSMRTDAEGDGKARWAAQADPRVTRVGRLIRRARIDELPQLFNVLRNDMSLVGPRPERPVFVAELTRQIPFYGARHSVKPGLTGWAQVRYTYGASVEDAVVKLQYDLYYVKNHSLFLDLLILLGTVRVVLGSKGAR